MGSLSSLFRLPKAKDSYFSIIASVFNCCESSHLSLVGRASCIRLEGSQNLCLYDRTSFRRELKFPVIIVCFFHIFILLFWDVSREDIVLVSNSRYIVFHYNADCRREHGVLGRFRVAAIPFEKAHAGDRGKFLP